MNPKEVERKKEKKGLSNLTIFFFAVSGSSPSREHVDIFFLLFYYFISGNVRSGGEKRVTVTREEEQHPRRQDGGHCYIPHPRTWSRGPHTPGHASNLCSGKRNRSVSDPRDDSQIP